MYIKRAANSGRKGNKVVGVGRKRTWKFRGKRMKVYLVGAALALLYLSHTVEGVKLYGKLSVLLKLTFLF